MNRNLINKMYRRIEAGETPAITAFRFDDYLRAGEEAHWTIYTVKNNQLADHQYMNNEDFYRFITENEMNLFAYWDGVMYGDTGRMKGKTDFSTFMDYVKNNSIPDDAPRGELKTPWLPKKENTNV